MQNDAYSTAAPYVPETRSVPALRNAVKSCEGCPLYKFATQAVFGIGPSRAAAMLVGEQPGNDEDLQGLPFVGPAGKLLDKALMEAGFERANVYLTNAVKHFKFEERGKRRLHKQPTVREVRACHPWLEAEIHAVRPDVVVCLGATAAKSILGNQFRLTVDRGKAIKHDLVANVVATMHPAAILRQPEPEARHAEFARLVEDLRLARGLLGDAANV